MKSTRQAEEDALRIAQLLHYSLPQEVKDELTARCEEIMAGKDPYKRDAKKK